MLAIDDLLLEHRFDFNWLDPFGHTPLMYCSMSQTPAQSWMRNFRPTRLRFLLDHSADLEAMSSVGKTALYHAVEHNNVNAFVSLSKAGAKFDAITTGGWTILHVAVTRAKDIKLIQAFCDADPSRIALDLGDDYGYKPFELLVMRARLKWDGYPHRYPSVYSLWESRWIETAADPEQEYMIMEAFEILFRHIQDVQGVPEDPRYPPLNDLIISSVKNSNVTDVAIRNTSSLPGAWPE